MPRKEDRPLSDEEKKAAQRLSADKLKMCLNTSSKLKLIKINISNESFMTFAYNGKVLSNDKEYKKALTDETGLDFEKGAQEDKRFYRKLMKEMLEKVFRLFLNALYMQKFQTIHLKC